VRRGGRAVDRDLHAIDAERGDAVGGGVVDAAAVGLELERDAARGEAVEHVPAVRDAERLAAAESDIRNAGFADGAGELERLVPAQLVAPRLVGARLLAAREAAGAAAVGQLPGKKEGRSVIVYGAPLHRFGKIR
jgi:hypothetical protein